jgi:hypothetical protein
MTQARNGENERKRRTSSGAFSRRVALFLLSFFGTTVLVSAQSAPPNRTDTPGASSTADQPDEANNPNPPSLMKPLKPVSQEAPYDPITPRQRLRWFITNTAGPPHLVGGLFVAGFGTALDRPEEYGTHWGGFGDRYGMRMTGIVTGNAMEASFGYLRGEDPRYFRVEDRPFKERLRNVVRLTFMARLDDGSYGPAYARYIAVAGNNFLSNTWRASSEANTHDALLRIAEGFAGRMSINAYEEFWPSIKKSVFHRHD